MRAGIAVFDAERRLRFVNRSYADMWGLDYGWLSHGPTQNEILEALREQRRLPEVVDFAAFRRELDQRFQTLIEPSEQLLHLPDARCFREVCAPHPLGGLVFVIEDVTDRLALETSYNTLIDVQRGILDQLADGMAAFGTDGRLSVFNPAFAAFINAQQCRLAGGEHLSIILDQLAPLAANAADWELFRETAQRSIKPRKTARQRVFLNDGRTIDLVLAPLADGSVLLSIRDITDTNNVERILLERNAALEETSRLKTNFLANASYELRTPLTTISGFVELIMEPIGGPVTDQQAEYLLAIMEASETLAALIDSILDSSPIESGQLDTNTESISLAPILNSVAEVVRPQLESKQAHLTIQNDPKLGPIEADERRLRQLIFNLLTSAARICASGSVIELTSTGNATNVIVQAKAQSTLDHSHVRAIENDLTLTLVRRLSEMHGGRMDIIIDDANTIGIRCVLARNHISAPEPLSNAAE